jgi:hypothetical protein
MMNSPLPRYVPPSPAAPNPLARQFAPAYAPPSVSWMPSAQPFALTNVPPAYLAPSAPQESLWTSPTSLPRSDTLPTLPSVSSTVLPSLSVLPEPSVAPAATALTVSAPADLTQPRTLTAVERIAADMGLSQWFGARDITAPLPKLLASPVKQGILKGWLASRLLTPMTIPVVQGLIRTNGANPAAVLVGLLLEFGAWVGFGLLFKHQREKNNAQVIDAMKHLPEGATKADYLAYKQQNNPLLTSAGR